MEGRMEGQKDGQTIFFRTLPVEAGLQQDDPSKKSGAIIS